jgi:uncharacterized protein (TIGR03083 family)
VDRRQYLEAIARDGGLLADAANGNLRAAVPSCPGWDVAELVWHTLEVHAFWGQVAGRRLQDHAHAVEPPRPPDDRLVTEFRRGVEELTRVLAGADPKATVWTWAPQKNVAFIQRRMAQETAVHRWDAQAAAGRAAPIDSALAVDGVDEFLDFMLPDVRAEQTDSASYSVHLHSTDSPGEWVVRVAGQEATVDRTHQKADVAVRAGASDLLLLLWRRIGPEDVDALGDADLLANFLARTDLS